MRLFCNYYRKAAFFYNDGHIEMEQNILYPQYKDPLIKGSIASEE